MTVVGILGALWGIVGVLLLLGSAIYRLTSVFWEAFSYVFEWYHWVGLTGCVLFMIVSEGYQGFQKAFSPRVVARARYLIAFPSILFSLLAPLFCMGYFHATRRRQIASIVLTVGIVLMILAVRLVPQPWRGIIDAGVVAGLAWGVVTLLVFCVRAFLTDGFDYSPEVPEEDSGPVSGEQRYGD